MRPKYVSHTDLQLHLKIFSNRVFTYNNTCILHAANTIYGKTFEWENFCDWYANDHSWENLRDCQTQSCQVLHELTIYYIE